MTVRDPVCGMCFEWEEAHTFQRVGEAVAYFCCQGCATRFAVAPDRYLDSHPAPSDASGCPETAGRRANTSHGIPATVQLERLPRVGTLQLDEFERRVHRAWMGPGRHGSECRVLGRALLSRVLGWGDPHRISVRIAAEISVVRKQCEDLPAVLEHLTSLPYAVATAGRDAGLTDTEIDRLQSAVAREVADASRWLNATRPDVATSLTNRTQDDP